LSEGEPIIQFPRSTGERGAARQWTSTHQQISFDRKELNLILNLYGKYVAQGEWRDYAMDFGSELATFSIFRRSSEVPLYRIVKNPALARRQGLYAVVAQGGLVLKRGHDLAQVLAVLVRKPRLAIP
jgi:glycogen debranching enzyme